MADIDTDAREALRLLEEATPPSLWYLVSNLYIEAGKWGFAPDRVAPRRWVMTNTKGAVVATVDLGDGVARWW